MLEHGEECFHVPLVLVVLRHQGGLQVHCGLHRELYLVSRLLFFLLDNSIIGDYLADCVIHLKYWQRRLPFQVFDVKKPIVFEFHKPSDLGLMLLQEDTVGLKLGPRDCLILYVGFHFDC